MSKVLIVIDMQNDFITGSLGTEEAKLIVPNVVEKVKKCEEEGYAIVFTQDTHENDYLETQEGKNLPVEHCVCYTHGWNICEELREYRDKTTSYEKDTFGSKYLVHDLTYNKDVLFDYSEVEEEIEEIELCGLCTDICVISNALLAKAFLPEVKITVDASCCAGVTPQSHKNALEAMKMCQINIINEEV